LAAGVVHILPEAQETMQKFNNGKESFPWPFFAAVVSFSVVLYFDKILFTNNNGCNVDVAECYTNNMEDMKSSRSKLERNPQYP